MNNAAAHYMLTEAQPSSTYMFYRSAWCHIVSLGHLSCLCPLPAFCAPPAFSLAGYHEKLKRPWLSVSTALQQVEHQCVFSIILILNPKHTTMPTTRRKINSVPAKIKTLTFPLQHIHEPRMETCCKSHIVSRFQLHFQNKETEIGMIAALIKWCSSEKTKSIK